MGFPTAKPGHFIVSQEKTQFSLTGDHTAFGSQVIMIPKNTITLHRNFQRLAFDEALTDNASQRIFKNWSEKALQLKTQTGLYINLHEAALINYPAMHLNLIQTPILLSHGSLQMLLKYGVYGNSSNTPWRTVAASFDAKDILASRITYNLNEPWQSRTPVGFTINIWVYGGK